MKEISYFSMILLGCILTFMACNNHKQKTDDSKEYLEAEEMAANCEDSNDEQATFFSEREDKENDLPEDVKRILAQADMEASMARQKINERFDKLFEAQTKLEETRAYASQFDRGTSDYNIAQRKVKSAEKDLQAILDDVNGRYARVIGFLFSESTSKSLIESSRDLIEAKKCREIYEKYKQIGSDYIRYKYTGVTPEDY